MRLQTLVKALFPPECLNCGVRVEGDFALCASCWGKTPFIFGAACDVCGTGLPGQDGTNEALVCEDCYVVPRPWDRGRAVLAYADLGRRLVLGLKHADRAEVARASGQWLARAGADLLQQNSLLVPIPLHWARLAKRKFNQAALLAQAMGHATGAEVAVDALIRPLRTATQDGRNADARFANLDGAIQPHPRHGARLSGRSVILIDDVMTSGGTFSAASAACRAAGAGRIDILALARVARET